MTESNTWKQTNRVNPLLVTGAAGRVGAIGRTVTEKQLKKGKAVRAMVRNEDERAQALRDMGAEVVVGNLLDLDSKHRGYRERKGKDDKLGEKIATGGRLSGLIVIPGAEDFAGARPRKTFKTECRFFVPFSDLSSKGNILPYPLAHCPG